MAVQIQFRRDTSANWASANSVLAAGEMGINTSTNQFKIGDGTTAWNSLSYAALSETVANLDDVTNVTITSAANGDLLKWNGSAWVNASGYALLASPTLTGIPAAPTAAANTNTTQIATTAFVTGAVTDLIGGAPGALNTLNELAEAIGDDASYAAGITTALGLKAPLASPTFTGTVTIPTGASITAPTGLVKGDVGLGNVDNTSNATERAATATLTNKTLTSPVINTPTGIVKGDVGLGNVDNTADTAKPVSTAGQTALDLKANLASPTFTGTPTLPTGTIATTQTAANNSTAIATTAYVDGLTVNGLSDTTITSVSSGQFLKWNGSAWINDNVPVINSIDDITGVTLTSPANGQLLQYNGSAWVNATLSLTPDFSDANNVLANAVFN